MGMTDAQFKGFLRFLLNALEAVERENDPEQKEELFQKIKSDLQATLED